VAATVNPNRVQFFQQLFDYTYWGRDRIIAAASKLTAEQLTAPTWLDHGSIHATLVHQLASEFLFRQRWEGSSPTRVLDTGDLPDLGSLTQHWREQETAVVRFLAGLTDADLSRRVEYRSRAGEPQSDLLWQVLFQIVNHSTQHRSEVALALTQLGQSPGFLDYMAYVRERPA
jgi:uncharacterized damage-inducible protein DinB